MFWNPERLALPGKQRSLTGGQTITHYQLQDTIFILWSCRLDMKTTYLRQTLSFHPKTLQCPEQYAGSAPRGNPHEQEKPRVAKTQSQQQIRKMSLSREILLEIYQNMAALQRIFAANHGRFCAIMHGNSVLGSHRKLISSIRQSG
jgi:hypothetical protein